MKSFYDENLLIQNNHQYASWCIALDWFSFLSLITESRFMGCRASPSITIGDFGSRWSRAWRSWWSRTDSRQLWRSSRARSISSARWRWRCKWKFSWNRKSWHIPRSGWKIHKPQWDNADSHWRRWIRSAAKRFNAASSTRKWTFFVDIGSKYTALSNTELSRTV